MPLMYGIIAKQIIELAKAGERDPNLLREGAIDQKQTNGLTSRYVRLVPQADIRPPIRTRGHKFETLCRQSGGAERFAQRGG